MIAKKLKIGMVSPFPPKNDGIAIYSNNLLENIKSKIEVVRIGDMESSAEYKIDFTSFSLKRKLWHISQKEHLDILHIQYVPTLFGKYNLNINLINALNIKTKTIITLHEVHYEQQNLKEIILSKIEKEIVKRATKVIVHTPAQKRFMEERYMAKNIVCIYQGLNIINSKGKKRGHNILFFGYITPLKGIHYLIRAMNYLPKYKLKIAGHIPKGVELKYKDMLITEIKDNRLDNRINLDIQWIPEDIKMEYFKWANIVVLPYVWAPYQSAVLHDAVGYGLPVIVTKIGSLFEIVEIFKFGEIVPPHQPMILAERIKKIYRDYESYTKGITDYQELANWQNIGNEYISLYNSIMNVGK